MSETLVEVRDLTKTFGKVCALNRVNFHVRHAEVVGLLGDNGAGKSTLVKIISGVFPPDSGQLLVKGEPVAGWNVARARTTGIETVYQDKALVPQQTICRNIFLGRDLTRFLGFVDVKKQRVEADRLMREIGFTSKALSPDSIVGSLSGGEREGVAIARALYFDADLIILDEPTTALSLTEAEKVFNFVRKAKEKGCACIFISHNIYHTYGVADRFVVLDRGRLAMESTRPDMSVERLIANMQAIAKTGHCPLG